MNDNFKINHKSDISCLFQVILYFLIPIATIWIFHQGAGHLIPRLSYMGEWKALDVPPEPAETIVKLDFKSVDIRTTGGEIFTYQPGSVTEEALHGSWIEVSEPTEIEYFPRCNPDEIPSSKPPPGQVKELHGFNWCPEFILHVKYALLEDGSIWRWEDPVDFFTGAGIYLFCLLSGLAVGILLDIAISKYLRRRIRAV